MKITADTNILVRAVVLDDKVQADAAVELLQSAELIAVPTPCLCEFVWVLKRVYGFSTRDISAAIGALMDVASVSANRGAVEAGLAVLEAGGDFADGAIAFEGTWLGGETFVSFDQQAVSVLSRQGQSASVLI